VTSSLLHCRYLQCDSSGYWNESALILTRVWVTLDWVLDWILDLLTTLTPNSWLHLIIVPSLISTLYKSLKHTLTFLARSVLSSCCLVTSPTMTILLLLCSSLLWMAGPFQLTNFQMWRGHNISARTNRNHNSSIIVQIVLVRKCFVSRYPVTALVLLLISRSLPSNGSTRYNIFGPLRRKWKS
jgi:hypothetical protein